jgi:predicted  nucleic acid-binding Zn-ribbon protein
MKLALANFKRSKVYVMVDVYKKIEKRIVDLKEKEEIWKKRYTELAQEVKSLVEVNSKQITEMDRRVRKAEDKANSLESIVSKASSKDNDAFRMLEKKTKELSDIAKGLDKRLDEKDVEIKNLRLGVLNDTKTIILAHEKTFDTALSKINSSLQQMQESAKAAEMFYQKIDALKSVVGEIATMKSKAAESDGKAFNPPMPQSGFQLEPVPLPRRVFRSLPEDDLELDDDSDLDFPEKVRDFRGSVSSVNGSMSSISQKLSAIEGMFEKAQKDKAVAVEKLDDKVRMYRESIAGLQSRMETIERAMKDGVSPMMESMKMLAEAVKELKEGAEAKPAIRKPSPPANGKKASSDAFNLKSIKEPTPSNRAPSTYQRR